MNRSQQPMSRLAKMESLIQQFQTLREAKRKKRFEQIADFINTFEEASRNFRRQRPADFNFFSLLSLEGDEVRHSRFIAWLLDPAQSHGQGAIFLRAFIDCCRLDLPVADSDRFRVETERSGPESIIDIMIYSHRNFLIFLENKVYALEQPDQIDREFRDMRRLGEALRIPESRRRAIFLTPGGYRPISGDASRWQTLSYGGLAEAFRRLLPEISEAKLKFVLSDWLDTVSAFGGSNDRF